jgi:23S rRNA (guanosine2251-2'-O)-methyltransferase
VAKHKHPKKSSTPKGYFVIGRNACRELLRVTPGRVKSIAIAEGNDRQSCADIYDLAKECGASVEVKTRDELTQLCATSSHQGFVIEASPPERLKVKEVLADLTGERATFIALDSVTDPHNIGAILRAAECFGVDGVIIPADRCGDITPVVTKVSVGASELVPIIQVKNLVKALQQFKDAGFWVVGAAVSDGAEPLAKFSFPGKTVIVLGAEGAGIRRLVLEHCDFQVYVPMHGNIDSLNVSQAASVIMYQRAAGLT